MSFRVAGVRGGGKQIEVEASVLPRVTADLPTISVSPVSQWNQLSGLDLADPDYGTPARVDILLGGKVFSRAILHGWRFGPTGAPSAFKTCFGWVLNGEAKGQSGQGTSHICCVALEDDSLRRFWEIEDYNLQDPVLSPEEKTVVEEFHHHHANDEEGRFIVPLPRKMNVTPLGDSKTQALRRMRSLERSLRAKGSFERFAEVMHEYFEKDHAEQVPPKEMDKPRGEVYYTFPCTRSIRREVLQASYALFSMRQRSQHRVLL